MAQPTNNSRCGEFGGAFEKRIVIVVQPFFLQHMVLVQDWSNASSICRAFSVGKNEAHAVANLQTRMPEEVLQALKVAVCKRGMRNFITHDLIVKGAFNDGFSSGQACLEAWQQELTNGQDMLLVTYQPISLNLYPNFKGLILVAFRDLIGDFIALLAFCVLMTVDSGEAFFAATLCGLGCIAGCFAKIIHLQGCAWGAPVMRHVHLLHGDAPATVTC